MQTLQSTSSRNGSHRRWDEEWGWEVRRGGVEGGGEGGGAGRSGKIIIRALRAVSGQIITGKDIFENAVWFCRGEVGVSKKKKRPDLSLGVCLLCWVCFAVSRTVAFYEPCTISGSPYVFILPLGDCSECLHLRLRPPIHTAQRGEKGRKG